MTDSERLVQLATRPVGRLLWQYSLPSIAGMLIMSLYNVVDRIILGQVVGADAIAGLTVTFPVMNLATAIGVLVGVGACSRVSILLGAKDSERAGQTLGNALTLTLINGIIYLTFFAVFLDPMLRLFGASEVTLPYARDFMQWILPGLLMMNLAFGFNNIMRSSGYPLKAMATMFIGAGLNIILAATFVYYLDMGIKGAAIASDISMTVTAAFVMSHFMRRRSVLHFTCGTFRLQWTVVADIVSIGASPCLINAASCFINIIINHTLLEYGGDTAIGAAGVFVTYSSLIVTVVLGFNMGMQPILGYNYGAMLIERLRNTFWQAAGWSTLVCLAGWAGAHYFADNIAGAFTTDDTLIAVVGHSLPIAMSAFMVVGLQVVATGFFQSIGKARKSIFLSLARQVIFLIPLLLVLPRFVGIDGVWMSFPVSDMLATVVTLAMVLSQLRQLRRMTPGIDMAV